METRIRYVKGDATEPQGDGKKITYRTLTQQGVAVTVYDLR